MTLNNTPREGISCPRCGRGRWSLCKTPAKMPRAWCRKRDGGCGHSWPPAGWGWSRGPGFAPVSAGKIDTLERLLSAGYTDKPLLMAAAGIGKHSLTKYSRRWQAKQQPK